MIYLKRNLLDTLVIMSSDKRFCIELNITKLNHKTKLKHPMKSVLKTLFGLYCYKIIISKIIEDSGRKYALEFRYLMYQKLRKTYIILNLI